MKRGLWTSTGAVFGVATAMGVFAYNYWMYCCGRCTVSSLLTLGPFGLLLLGCTVAGMGLLAAMRYFRSRRYAKDTCACGILLVRSWRYCPSCGARRQTLANSSES